MGQPKQIVDRQGAIPRLVKAVGWLMVADGLTTVLFGRVFMRRLVKVLPEGLGRFAAFFYFWPDFLLRLGGAVQVAAGLGLWASGQTVLEKLNSGYFSVK